MIRRRTVQIVALLATLTVAGCQDDAIPTAVPLKATPRGPSYTYFTRGDVTYPVHHGTLRVWDANITTVADGKSHGVGAFVAPGALVRFTGKWQIGPITDVADCTQCDYALHAALVGPSPSVTQLVVTRSPELNAEPGQSGEFDWVAQAPNKGSANVAVMAGYSVSSSLDFPTTVTQGWPTGTPGAAVYVSLVLTVMGPTITPNVTGTVGENDWYTSDVGVSWTIDEQGGAATGKTGCDPIAVTTDTDGSTYTCSVTSEYGTGTQSVKIKRDRTRPTLNPRISPNPVPWRGSATVTPNASDGGSGIASDSCGKLDTQTIGVHTVSCMATDNAGNQRFVNVDYFVRSTYVFGGFATPVDPAPTWNTAKAGSAVPIKFSLGGDFGLDIFAGGYPRWQSTSCPAAPNDNPVDETTTAAGGNTLTYDATTGLYTYVWKSAKNWANSCGDLVMRFADGSEYSARFQFKK